MCKSSRKIVPLYTFAQEFYHLLTMQDKVKVEMLDLTEDSEEEQGIKLEPLTPVKENNDPLDSETGESSGLQKSPSGRFVRNVDKCLEKAIEEIKKGQSLIAVASQFGVHQDVLYNKLVSRNIPRETEILTSAEESALFKWIVKANKNNTLIFKHQLMEKVGKLKKVLNITPIFAKSKFGRMWYEYFMKKHPEIYENEGLLMPSDKILAHSLPQGDLEKKNTSMPDPEDVNILTPEEEDALVNWIVTSNKNNSLIFKYQLMRRVGKLNKVSKSTPGFAKSKFGKMWYEHFLKKHPEIYENDELLLPSENVLDEKVNQWPDEEDIKLAQNTFKLSTDSDNNMKHSTALLLSCGIKDAIVVLHDFRKEKNPPYRLNGEGVFVLPNSGNDIENIKEENPVKHELSIEYVDSYKDNLASELDESGIESDQHYSDEGDEIPFKPYINFKRKYRKHTRRNEFGKTSEEKVVCERCARSFSNLSKLKRHILTVHQPRELHQITCLHCKKRFSSKYHLSVHMTTHSVLKYNVCGDCGKRFKFRTSMRKHQRTVHEGLESHAVFYCDICEKGFKYKNSLEAHIIYGHMNEKKKFSCNICNMSFIRHSLMLRHKTRHSKLKPMVCMHCGKTYSRKYLLKEHIKGCTIAKKNKTIPKNCDESSEENSDEVVVD